MPRRTAPALAAVMASVFVLLALLIACSSETPTPEPPAEPTKFAVSQATNSPVPSDTATTAPTPTEISTPTNTPLPTPTSPGPQVIQSGMSQNVWFMGPLIEYFSNLGDYPPEPPLERPANVNPLTGLEVSDPALLQRRPLLVRLGNDPKARPQAGLNQADLVFEEMIDQKGGFFALTRLTAVYLGQNATVRPLRSARPINASLQPMFDGALAHSGASKDGRFLFSQLPWGQPVTASANLDDLWFGNAYCVIGSSWITRVASTVEHIHAVIESKGLEKSVPLRGFVFSPDVPPGTPATAVALDHKPWPVNAGGTAEWKYDAASGRYLRFASGVAHNTQQYSIAGKWGDGCSISGPVTTEQVSAANVVVLNALYEPTSFVEDSLGSAAAFVELTGSGTARIYRDGVEIVGTWQRPTLQHFIEFVDAGGKVIPLKPGNTWFEIAPVGYVPTVE